jgi:hypothetical protein
MDVILICDDVGSMTLLCFFPPHTGGQMVIGGCGGSLWHGIIYHSYDILSSRFKKTLHRRFFGADIFKIHTFLNYCVKASVLSKGDFSNSFKIFATSELEEW